MSKKKEASKDGVGCIIDARELRVRISSRTDMDTRVYDDGHYFTVVSTANIDGRIVSNKFSVSKIMLNSAIEINSVIDETSRQILGRFENYKVHSDYLKTVSDKTTYNCNCSPIETEWWLSSDQESAQ